MFVIFDYREIKKKNRVNVEADYSSSQNWHNSWSYFTMNHSNPLCKLYVIFIIVAVIITCIITVVLLHPCSSLWLCWSRLSSSWRWWSSFTSLLLTLSLPQPVRFPGWMTHARACKQYTFRSYNICFQFYTFWWRSFHMAVPKRRQRIKGFKFRIISRFQITSWQWRG